MNAYKIIQKIILVLWTAYWVFRAVPLGAAAEPPAAGNPLAAEQPPAAEGPPAQPPPEAPRPGTLNIDAGSEQNRITLHAADASLADVIRLLAAQANLNLVLAPDVTGTVTTDLKDVTVEQALQTVLEANGYVAQMQAGGDPRSNILRIARSALAAESMQPRMYQLHAVSVNDVQAAITKMLSDGGRFVPQAQRNAFIVIDRPEVLAAVDQFLATADGRERQVMIKAQLVEHTLEDRDQMGFHWDWLDARAGSLHHITGTVTQDLLPEDDNFSIAFGNQHFSSIFQALSTHGKVNLLSSPTITTVNNQEAKVEITEDIPYIESTTSIEAAAAGGSTTTTQSVEFVTVGVKLTVLPQIGEDDFIKMKITPEVSEAPTRYLGIPVVKKRSADTTVIVRNGQLIVMGGLMREEVTQDVKRVPLLGSIPVLGVLFRSSDNRTTKVELLIFIRPLIVESDSTAAEVEGQKAHVLGDVED